MKVNTFGHESIYLYIKEPRGGTLETKAHPGMIKNDFLSSNTG